MTMQTKVLNNLKNVLTAKGMEAIVCADFSNKGHLSIQKPNQVGELGSIHYDFQSSTMTLSITIKGKQILSQPPRLNYYDFYLQHTDIEGYQNFVYTLKKELQNAL